MTMGSGDLDVFFFPIVSTRLPIPVSFSWTLFHNSVLDPWLLFIVIVVVRAAMRVRIVVRMVGVMVVSFAHDYSCRLVLILVQVLRYLVSSHGGECAWLGAGRPDTLGVPVALFDSDVCHVIDVVLFSSEREADGLRAQATVCLVVTSRIDGWLSKRGWRG